MRLLVGLALLASPLLSASPASAQTTYYVDNTNGAASDSNDGSQGSPWLTIGKCASTLVAGDTCSVQAGGSYDERVSASTSGSASAMIRYAAGGGTRPKVRAFTLAGSYIRVEGFEITSQGMSTDTNRSVVFTSQDHIEIVDNQIHDTTSSAIFAQDFSTGANNAQFCVIRNNVVSNTGPDTDRAVAIQVSGDDCLLEGNDVSHFEDAFRIFGQRDVIRNNVVHGVTMAEEAGAHPDAIQSFCNGNSTNDEAVSYLLVERLFVYDMRGTDAHGILINGTDSCGGSSTVIARESSFFQVGSGIYYGDDNAAFGDHHKAYNNSIADSELDSPNHVAMTFSGIDFAGVFNNIFVDTIAETAPFTVYDLKPNSNSAGDYNLAFMSSGPKSWGSPIVDETNAILDQDPSFVDVATGNLTLQAGSPAIDKGGPLTAVASGDSGGGTTLVVDDAHFFQPGWAGTQGDVIAVGTVGNTAQIASIDYAQNTITLASAVTRSPGDPIWLYQNSSGETVLVGSAPDIGAFEFGAQVDAGIPDGSSGSGGGSADGGGVGGGGVGGAGASPDAGSPTKASDQGNDSGCGCRSAGAGGASVSALFALLALVVLGRRRREAK